MCITKCLAVAQKRRRRHKKNYCTTQYCNDCLCFYAICICLHV